MKPAMSLHSGLAVISLLACLSTVNAHTWVETMRLIASNGTFVGTAGYPRAYQPRTPTFEDDNSVYKLIDILPSSPMCKSTQTLGNQTEGYPTLVAAGGDQVSLRYLENGHVTLFTTQPGKPLGRGTVFIYGTTSPSPSDTYLGIHRVWNAEGTGGNGKGKLLATRPFDDGRCFQVNSSPLAASRAAAVDFPAATELGCQADFQIPSDAPASGTYTVYWVWEWPYLYNNGAIQTNESYTTCMDITLTSNAVPAAGSFDTAQVSGIAANSAGIQAQLSTQFLVNPTALPQVAQDNLNKASTPPDVPAPSQAPAAAASGASSSAASIATSPSATGGFVTITVTAHEVQTVTVTKPIASSKALTSASAVVSKNTVTVVPIPASTSTSTTTSSSVSSSETSSFSAVSEPSGQYTTASTLPTLTPFLNTARSTPATSDCSNMTTSAHAKRMVKLRGRSVRL